jgi:hypothetical protein
VGAGRDSGGSEEKATRGEEEDEANEVEVEISAPPLIAEGVEQSTRTVEEEGSGELSLLAELSESREAGSVAAT